MKRSLLALPILATAFLVAGCESPPTKELSVAQTELQRALDGDADVFAATTLDEAEAALRTAHERVSAREYRAALSAALDATQKSRDALAGAETAKRRLQAEAQAVVRSSDEALATLARRRPLTPVAKPGVDAPECESLVDQARDFNDTLRRHLAEADLVSVHEEVPVVKNAIAQAEAACKPRASTSRRRG